MDDGKTTSGSALSRNDPHTPEHSRGKRLAFATISVALAIAACLLVLEVVLRVSDWEIRYKHHIGALHRYHPVIGREQVPLRVARVAAGDQEVLYRINAAGFRDPDETALARTPGVPRIVVIGDSLAWGWGVPVEETVSERLEELTGAEVINMAHIAFGTGQEWLVLEERGFAYDLDIVVLLFFAGNDYRNNLSRRSSKPHFDLLEDGRVAVSNVPVPHPLSSRFKDFAKRNSLSYFFVGYHFRVLRNRIKHSEGWLADVYNAVSFRKRRKRREEADLTLLDKYRVTPTEEMQRAYALTEGLLEEVRRACEDEGVELLVAVIPDRFEVEDEAWKTLLAQAGGAPGDVDRSKPSRIGLDLGKRVGIETLDLSPDLLASEREGQPVHLPEDIHWSARGHEVASEAIGRELTRLGWLANPPN